MTRGSSHPSTRRGAALAALAVLVTVAAALLAPAGAAAAPVPFVVANQFGGQAGPEIAGAMSVWTDNRNGNLDIYGKNLSTKKAYAVCTNKQQQDNPAVTRWVTPSGKVHYVAVWVDKRNHVGGEATDIYGRDITRGRNFLVSRSATVKWFPDIVDRWVVWIEADDPAGPYRIKARDLDASRTYLVATSRVLSPVAIDRRTVGSKTFYTAVYTSAKGDISARNVPAGRSFVISKKAKFEWMPDISHNRVVWWESGGRIMMRNLKTHVRSFVHGGSRPRIDGEFVTWDGGGHGGSFVIDYVAGAKIYVRNVARNTATVSFAVAHQTSLFPSISGHRVVWEAGPAQRVLSHIHIFGARLR